VRSLDDNGKYVEAVTFSTGPQGQGTWDRLVSDLTRSLDINQAVFTRKAAAAGTGLDALIVIIPLTVVLIGVLAAGGLRTRLKEYQ
jgi:hypothetical protein